MTTQTETIAQILKQAKENKWPYPKTFQLLKEGGVTSYRVLWGETYQGLYKGTFGEWLEPAPKGYRPVSGTFAFNKEKIKECIQRHQKGQTTFVEWLEEIFKVGVTHYVVDIGKRSVTYYSVEENQSYVDKVPEYQQSS
jgi:uncharacterized protein YbcV (DUF1398 family)